MGKNRRSKQRARELQAAKSNTITLNNHGVSMTDQPMYPSVEATKVVGDYDDNPVVPDDTTLVEATAYAEASVTKAADLEGVPFSVQMLDVIRMSGLQGVTLDDLYNRFPHIKRSSVTARLSEAKKKGTVMEVGARIGTSGRTLPVIVAVTP